MCSRLIFSWKHHITDDRCTFHSSIQNQRLDIRYILDRSGVVVELASHVNGGRTLKSEGDASVNDWGDDQAPAAVNMLVNETVADTLNLDASLSVEVWDDNVTRPSLEDLKVCVESSDEIAIIVDVSSGARVVESSTWNRDIVTQVQKMRIYDAEKRKRSTTHNAQNGSWMHLLLVNGR